MADQPVVRGTGCIALENQRNLTQWTTMRLPVCRVTDGEKTGRRRRSLRPGSGEEPGEEKFRGVNGPMDTSSKGRILKIRTISGDKRYIQKYFLYIVIYLCLFTHYVYNKIIVST